MQLEQSISWKKNGNTPFPRKFGGIRCGLSEEDAGGQQRARLQAHRSCTS